MIHFLKDKKDVPEYLNLFDKERPDGAAKEITALLAWNKRLIFSERFPSDPRVSMEMFVIHLCQVHDEVEKTTKGSILEHLHKKKIEKKKAKKTKKEISFDPIDPKVLGLLTQTLEEEHSIKTFDLDDPHDKYIDSLERVELAMLFEDHFGLMLEDDDIARCKTFRQFALLVTKEIKKQEKKKGKQE